MHVSKYWLLVLAIVAGFVCGRALRAEDADCGCGSSASGVASSVIETGYDENGIKTVYGPEEVRYQYVPFRFCDGPVFEPTSDMMRENLNDYGHWSPAPYPHRYDTGMGLGAAPGSTTGGYEFVYGLGTVYPCSHDPVGAVGDGTFSSTYRSSRMDTGLGSSPGSGASGPGAGAGAGL